MRKIKIVVAALTAHGINGLPLVGLTGFISATCLIIVSVKFVGRCTLPSVS